MIVIANVDLVMTGEGALSVRARSGRDVQIIVSWVEDAQALHLFSGPRLAWPLTSEQLQAMLTIEGLTASVVLSPAGDLVGHFDITMTGGVALLGRVIVNPALRGRGFASPIVSIAVAKAHELGAEVVRLNVITTNEPVIRAYRRAGFHVVPGDSSRGDVTVMERKTAPALL